MHRLFNLHRGQVPPPQCFHTAESFKIFSHKSPWNPDFISLLLSGMEHRGRHGITGLWYYCKAATKPSTKWHNILQHQSCCHEPPKDMAGWKWHSWRSLSPAKGYGSTVKDSSNFQILEFRDHTCSDCSTGKLHCIFYGTTTRAAVRMKHGTASIFTWIWHSCTASGSGLCSVKKRQWNVKDVWGRLKEECKPSFPCWHLIPLKSKTGLPVL